MDFGLKGKVSLVAAASRGLGRAVAEELAVEGRGGSFRRYCEQYHAWLRASLRIQFLRFEICRPYNLCGSDDSMTPQLS
jgi:hypothetical protein